MDIPTNLEDLKRVELQKLCKSHDIKANMKNVAMIAALMKIKASRNSEVSVEQNSIVTSEGDSLEDGNQMKDDNVQDEDLNIEQNKDEQSQHVEKDETEIISSEIKQFNASPVSFPRLTQSETSSSPSKQIPDEDFSDEELMDVEPHVDSDVCKALTFLNSPIKFNIPENKENIPNLDSPPNLKSSETETGTDQGTCAEDLKEYDFNHELNTTFTIESPEKQVSDPLTALSESLNVTPRLSDTPPQGCWGSREIQKTTTNPPPPSSLTSICSHIKHNDNVVGKESSLLQSMKNEETENSNENYHNEIMALLESRVEVIQKDPNYVPVAVTGGSKIPVKKSTAMTKINKQHNKQFNKMESISQTYERKKRRLESSDDTPGTKKLKVQLESCQKSKQQIESRRLATPKSVIKKPVSATPKIIKKSVTLPKSIQKSSRHKVFPSTPRPPFK